MIEHFLLGTKVQLRCNRLIVGYVVGQTQSTPPRPIVQVGTALDSTSSVKEWVDCDNLPFGDDWVTPVDEGDSAE